MKKVILSLFIILTMFMISCSPGGGTITGVGVVSHNDGIEKQVLDSVKNLDDGVLDGLKNNEPDKIIGISCDEFKKNSTSLKEELTTANKAIKDMSFEYKDKYYCKVGSVSKTNFTVTASKDDPFNIEVEGVNSDIFVSLIKTTSNKQDYLLTLVYIKENDEWKLKTFNIADYSLDGMNAIDLYEKAKSFEAQGYKIPANIYLGLCSKVLRPAPFIKYKQESEITDYSKKLSQSITDEHTFPEKLKDTQNVQIYGFRVEYTKNDGVIPIIRYVTGIGLDKKEALEKEANDMNKEVTEMYPGLKENSKYVLYEAYSEPPIDPKKTYNDYRTGVEQK